MARLRARVSCVVVLLALISWGAAAQTEKVFVTNTGEKYHRENCRSLAKSKIEIALAEAAARYEPCKVCKPPVPAAVPAASAAVAPATPAKIAAPAPAAATSGRCQATTKKGTQCSRNAQAGRNYCWQH